MNQFDDSFSVKEAAPFVRPKRTFFTPPKTAIAISQSPAVAPVANFQRPKRFNFSLLASKKSKKSSVGTRGDAKSTKYLEMYNKSPPMKKSNEILPTFMLFGDETPKGSMRLFVCVLSVPLMSDW